LDQIEIRELDYACLLKGEEESECLILVLH